MAEEKNKTAENMELAEILKNIKFNPEVLEKIGFAGRAFHVFRTFDVVHLVNTNLKIIFALRVWRQT